MSDASWEINLNTSVLACVLKCVVLTFPLVFFVSCTCSRCDPVFFLNLLLRSSSETRPWGSGSDRSGPLEFQREPVSWTQREWQQPVRGTVRLRGQRWQHTQHHQRWGRKKQTFFCFWRSKEVLMFYLVSFHKPSQINPTRFYREGISWLTHELQQCLDLIRDFYINRVKIIWTLWCHNFSWNVLTYLWEWEIRLRCW